MWQPPRSRLGGLLVGTACLLACGRLGFDERADGGHDGPTADARCELGFAPPLAFAAGTRGNGLALADLDGDGRLDATTSARGRRKLDILLSSPTDLLASRRMLLTPFEPQGIAAGDFDRDGATDLVVVGGGICVFRNLGGATFSECTMYPTGMAPISVATGTLDSDGAIDVVIGNLVDNTIGSYLNDGSGVLVRQSERLAGGTNPYSVALGDVTGDGNADVVSANLLADNFSVLAGDGAGGLANAVTYPTSEDPVGVAIGDLDGDLDLDVIVATLVSVDVFINAGVGVFEARRSTPIDALVIPMRRDLALGDLDRDGLLDVVATSSNEGAVAVYRNVGGALQPAVMYAAGPTPHDVEIADLDGDGLLDLAVASAEGDTLSVLLGGCTD